MGAYFSKRTGGKGGETRKREGEKKVKKGEGREEEAREGG